MGYILDILGSMIIGSAVILIILVLNLNIISSAAENLNTNIAQRDLTTTALVMEYDLYKMGYRVAKSKIEIADSNKIKFYSDLDNDGTKDSILYYLGDISRNNSTPNPYDRLLYRQENNDTATAFTVADFNLVYHDSIGNILDYSSLKNQLERDMIKTINIALTIESGEPIDGNYQTSRWEKKISPKNLRWGIEDG